MLGKHSHCEVFAHRVDRSVDSKNGARVFRIIAERGIVVRARLHRVVPEPQSPLGIKLRAFPVFQNALHRRPHRTHPLIIVQPLRRNQRTLRQKRLHRKFAEQRPRPLRRNAARNVARVIRRGRKAEHPVAQILSVRRILVGPVHADEEPIPVPHLRVITRRNEIRIANIPLQPAGWSAAQDAQSPQSRPA